MWGRMENFKCVDYFQVEYFERLNPARTVQVTERINRHRRSVEIEVIPCTDYFFKVIASEDWKGMREDFKVFSEVVGYRLKYTPKFINPPIVKERGRRYRPGETRGDRRRPPQRRDLVPGAPGAGPQNQIMAPDGTMLGPAGGPVVPVTEEPETFMIKIGWRLSDVDYPICLDYFVLDYYDTMYNESSFQRTFNRPFMKPKFELEVPNHIVPCEPDYEFIVYAFGFNKQSSQSVWTPPSCIKTTPAPTTTEAVVSVSVGVEETTESLADKMELVEAENEMLQAKIDGLKQEYEKIGLQVFVAFKEHFFQGLEDWLARSKSGGDSDAAGPSGNGTDPMFG